MQIAQKSATLNREEYRHAQELLEQEREAMQLSRSKRLAYSFLNIAVYGWFIFLLIAIAIGVAIEIAPGLSVPLKLPAGAALILSTALGLLSPLALIVNLPLIFKIWTKNRVLRNLGLEDFFHSELKRRGRSSRWREFLAKLLAALGLLLGLVGVYYLAGVFGGDILTTSPAGPRMSALLLIAAGFSVFCSYFVRRGRRKLKLVSDISGLITDLKSYTQNSAPAEPSEVTIPSEVLFKIENVERQQIQRDRQQTILMTSEQVKAPPYFVQKSRDVRNALDEVPVETQLLIDNALHNLTSDPLPEGAMKTTSGEFKLRIKGTPIRLKYSVDEASRNIRLLQFEHRKTDHV